MHVNLNFLYSFVGSLLHSRCYHSLGIQYQKTDKKKKELHTFSPQCTHRRTNNLFQILFLSSMLHACYFVALHDAYTPYKNSKPKQKKSTAKSFKRWILGWREFSINISSSCLRVYRYQPAKSVVYNFSLLIFFQALA